jgi:hypothetical protein
MKPQLIFFTFLFLTTIGYSQVKKVDIHIFGNGDTSNFYTSYAQNGEEMGISKLINSTELFHFRFWQFGQAVDIWTTDHKTYSGFVTSYAYKYTTPKRKKDDPEYERTITGTFNLDSSIARLAYLVIVESSISAIPSCDYISGWSIMGSGETFVFEISDPGSYAFKNYWHAGYHEDIPEAKQILALVKQLNAQLGLAKIHNEFTDALPEGQYRNEGSGIMTVGKRKKRQVR